MNPVIYYFDFAADGVTSGQIIRDKTDDTLDHSLLLEPDPFYDFLGNPPSSDDLATALVDGNSVIGQMGEAPGPPFSFHDGAGIPFLLPGGRVLDLDTTGHGALTVTENHLGHQNISDAGGFTFETYLRRAVDTTGSATQVIWSPEGAHTLEISFGGDLQLHLRGLTEPITRPVASALPLGEWHHVMATMRVVEPLPPGGDPESDSLVVNYSLYIDGVLVETTPDVDLIAGSCCILEFLDHEHGIGGSHIGIVGQHFRGQLALTRLSLGALSVEQSLFYVAPPENNGDYNQDGKVDAADFVMWRRSVGAEVEAGTLADGDGNGTIDGLDYAHWRARFGTLVGTGTGASIAVPEPTSAPCLLLFAVISIARLRR